MEGRTLRITRAQVRVNLPRSCTPRPGDQVLRTVSAALPRWIRTAARRGRLRQGLATCLSDHQILEC